MKNFIFLPIFVGLIGSASAPSLAEQNHQANSWLKEPTEFLGIDLHSNFNKQLPACADSSIRPKSLCRTATSSHGRFEIRGLPYLPISPGYRLFADAPDGNLKELVLSGSANSLHLVSDMLTDRFGDPKTVTSRWVKMASGASFQSEVLKWDGERVVISFQRDESDLSSYEVKLSGFTYTTDTIDNQEIIGSKNSGKHPEHPEI